MFQIFFISRNLPDAVILSSLVSVFILFRVCSKLQNYNKNLPERNAPADKSLMSNFFQEIILQYLFYQSEHLVRHIAERKVNPGSGSDY